MDRLATLSDGADTHADTDTDTGSDYCHKKQSDYGLIVLQVSYQVKLFSLKQYCINCMIFTFKLRRILTKPTSNQTATCKSQSQIKVKKF